MEFFLYVLIQETYPFTWIQLPCAYRWLLLAASLSPDLPAHQLQRLTTKNILIDTVHYHPPPPIPPPSLLQSHLKPNACPAPKTSSFSSISYLRKSPGAQRPPPSLLWTQHLPARSQHTVHKYSLIPPVGEREETVGKFLLRTCQVVTGEGTGRMSIFCWWEEGGL